MPPLLVAQALVERSVLDSAIAGVTSLVGGIGEVFQHRPYLIIVLAIVVFLLLNKRR